MTLLYLVAGNYLSKKNSAVQDKILAKVKALRETGIKVTLIEVSDQAEQEIEGQYTILSAKKKDWYRKMNDHLKKHGNLYDKVLLRYPNGCPELLEFVKDHPNRIFFEHNTFEDEEAALVQKRHFDTLSFSLSPSYLKYGYKALTKDTEEKRWGPEILKYAAGGICVTHELALYETKKYPAYKTFVVSNGAGEKSEFLLQAPPFTNTLKTFMLVGDQAPWQGFERIEEGLKRFKNPKFNIEVNIIGTEQAAREIPGLPSNCSIRFSRSSGNYFREYNLHEYHVAFSTLALYKKGMEEAAPLKLRDSMLRGFPAILAYRDTDIEGNDSLKSYVYNFPNDNSPLDFEAIINFYQRVREIGDYPEKIRQAARATFAYEAKALQLKQIFESN